VKTIKCWRISSEESQIEVVEVEKHHLYLVKVKTEKKIERKARSCEIGQNFERLLGRLAAKRVQ
jgi:hypothetical protein